MQEGDVIEGRYRVEKKLGQGGMGMVFRGHDLRNNKAVAIKSLFPNTPDIVIKRFHAEAIALGALNHPNIMTVQHFGQGKDDGQLYLVMDLIKGDSLNTMIEKRGSQTFFDVLPIFERICRGLRYAHMKGVLHRDIKPSNVMMSSDRSKDDSVKLVDFGLAKYADKEQELTKTGAAMGSPPYMSPEAVYGKHTDERSDIYSLGCTLFEMIAGRPPFTGEMPFHVMMAHVNKLAPTISEVSGKECEEEVEAFVAKCIKKDPNDRFQNMDDLIKALEKVKTTLTDKKRASEGILASGIYASGAFIAERKRLADEWLKRNTKLASIIGAVLILGTGGVIGYQNWLDSQAKNDVQEGFSAVSDAIAKPENEELILDMTEGKSTYDAGAHLIKDKSSRFDSCLLSGEMNLEQVKQAVEPYKKMKVFQFEQLEVDDECYKYILGLGMEKIVLYNTKLTPSLLEQIGKTKSINHLQILKCDNIPQGVLDGLAKSTSISNIELECGFEYKNVGNVLGRMKQLLAIVFLNTSLSESDITSIVRGVNLGWLSLKHCRLEPDALTNIKDAKICRLLEFPDTGLTVEQLAQIGQVPHLYSLNLHRTGTTDDGLPGLYGSRELNNINLTKNNVSPDAVARMKENMPKLREVILGKIVRDEAF